jgi:hypothetical protein
MAAAAIFPSSPKLLNYMVGGTGIEPVTPSMQGRRQRKVDFVYPPQAAVRIFPTTLAAAFCRKLGPKDTMSLRFDPEAEDRVTGPFRRQHSSGWRPA